MSQNLYDYMGHDEKVQIKYHFRNHVVNYYAHFSHDKAACPANRNCCIRCSTAGGCKELCCVSRWLLSGLRVLCVWRVQTVGLSVAAATGSAVALIMQVLQVPREEGGLFFAWISGPRGTACSSKAES